YFLKQGKRGETMTVRTTGTQQKRISILGEDEYKVLFGRPRFTYEDRCYYFSFLNPRKSYYKTCIPLNLKFILCYNLVISKPSTYFLHLNSMKWRKIFNMC